jgi:hypothetical protein
MPSRRLPNSTPAVIRTLTAAREAWKRFPADRLISADQWAQLDENQAAGLFNRFLKEAGDVDKALAAQAPLTSAQGQAIARLTLYVNHFHLVYDLGVQRGDFTAGGRAYYGRAVNATTIPDLSTLDSVITAAQAIVKGEADRQTAEAASFKPMALPAAADVAAILADAKQKRAAAEAAKLATDTEQGELTTLYPEAQRLAVSILNHIDFHLNERHDLDAPGRRRIARAWGVVYVNDDGSLNTDEPTTPEPAPTA